MNIPNEQEGKTPEQSAAQKMESRLGSQCQPANNSPSKEQHDQSGARAESRRKEQWSNHEAGEKRKQTAMRSPMEYSPRWFC